MKFLKLFLIPAFSLLLNYSASAATPDVKPEALPSGQNMYVIEREILGLGQWTPEQLKAASQKSCQVLDALGPKIQWLYSYVTGDKMYCIYLAPNEEMVREHAKEAGFPANTVNRVSTIIGPKTAG
jgi:Protein of unknown function (DUF4242)